MCGRRRRPVSEIRYTKKNPAYGENDTIELFWAAARSGLRDDLESASAVMLELQPGDGTRYRFCIAKPAPQYNPADQDPDPIVVAMLVPTFCVVELDLKGPRPTHYDTPMCTLNPYTGAIFADVLSAVVWGDEERAYDYDKSEPRNLRVFHGHDDSPADEGDTD